MTGLNKQSRPHQLSQSLLPMETPWVKPSPVSPPHLPTFYNFVSLSLWPFYHTLLSLVCHFKNGRWVVSVSSFVFLPHLCQLERFSWNSPHRVTQLDLGCWSCCLAFTLGHTQRKRKQERNREMWNVSSFPHRGERYSEGFSREQTWLCGNALSWDL